MTRSANDSWDEIENGYKSSGGATAVLVHPERFEEVGGEPHGEVVEDPAEGNVWVVVVTHSSHHWIATRFEGRDTAWEFADLLTHLFSELGYMPAKATMQDTSMTGEGQSLPKVVKEGADAETVLREAMGIDVHHLDRALEESE